MKNKDEVIYSRVEDLSEKFNSFWNNYFHDEKDYFKELTISNLVSLKKTVSNINNIITLRVTNQFVEYLHSEGIITASQKEEVLSNVDKIHPNSNGYDVKLTYPEIKIIAEVKCCIPAGTNSYGAAQEESIFTDIELLLDGKSKSGIKEGDNIKEYYKFMVLMAGEKVETSIAKLLVKLKKDPGKKVELYTSKNDLRKDTVYVVSIAPDKKYN